MEELGIGIIAPTEQLHRVVVGVAAEMGITHCTEVHQGNLEEALDTVRHMEQRGFSCVVTRGGTAELLNASNLVIPVICIPLTTHELSQAVFDAKRATGLARPRIALFTFHNMEENIDLFAKVLGAEMHVYKIHGTRDHIAETLDKAVAEGLDVVVGGEWTCQLARENGLTAVKLSSNPTSVRGALEEAMKVRYSAQLEKRRSASLRMLVDSIKDGLLHVDNEGIIRHANAAARDMLGAEQQEILGRDFRDVLPQFKHLLELPQESVEDVISMGATTALVTLSPMVGGIHSPTATANAASNPLSNAASHHAAPPALMVVMHETNRVAQMDARLRKRQAEKAAGGLSAVHRFSDITGRSPTLREAKRLATSYAASDATVLIYGESGTGKELFAQSLHNASPWANGPFVAVNCAALPPSLLESELFGYEEGAFTGASRKGKPGLIELAHKGTLFLDEISEMDHYGQVRMLRFLQERNIMRLGGDRYLPVQVRIIAATNRDLAALVASGHFRRDLYYRLRVLRLHLPPLRERAGDVPLLVDSLLQAQNQKLGRHLRCTQEARDALEKHCWPGNVRELSNIIECLAVGHSGKTITGVMARQVLALDHATLNTALITPSPSREQPATTPALAPPPPTWPGGATPTAWPGSATPSMPPPMPPLSAADVPSTGYSRTDYPSPSALLPSAFSPMPAFADEDERQSLVAALRQSRGHHGRAAVLLGMHRSTLYRKLKKWGLSED